MFKGQREKKKFGYFRKRIKKKMNSDLILMN